MMIVFLGGNGDIGSVAVPQLRAANHDVIAPSSSVLDLDDHFAVQEFFGSLRTGYGLVVAAFVDRRRGETTREYEKNQRIIENIVRYSAPSWLVFMSSIAVYGEHPLLPISENSPLEGNGLYARAKLSAERNVIEFAAGNFPCLNIRLPGIFGGIARRHQSLDVILRRGLKSGEISLGGNGNVLRDWASATEVAEFLMINVRNPKSGTVNFVRGVSISIDEYVAIALEVISEIRHHRASADEISTTSDFVFDGSRLQVEFPDWSFPPRERDIHKLARELKDLASRQIQL